MGVIRRISHKSFKLFRQNDWDLYKEIKMSKEQEFDFDAPSVFENDNYKILIGDLPGKYDEFQYQGYLVVNKATRVVEGAQTVLPYAKDVANGLDKLLKELAAPTAEPVQQGFQFN